MSYVLIVDDDANFTKMVRDCVNEHTRDKPVIVPIDEDIVLETVWALKADISMIFVNVELQTDKGGLQVLWNFNEAFPVCCVTSDPNLIEKELRAIATSRLSKRIMLHIAGSHDTLFKPCTRQMVTNALIQAHRVPGGA